MNSHLEGTIMKSTTIEEVAQTYGIENWGAGYFGINRQGHLIVRPAKGDTKEADVFEIVQDLVEQRKLSSPFLLRFPQILESQLNRLCSDEGQSSARSRRDVSA